MRNYRLRNFFCLGVGLSKNKFAIFYRLSGVGIQTLNPKFLPKRLYWLQAMREQIVFLKNGPIPASFCIFSFFSHSNSNDKFTI